MSRPTGPVEDRLAAALRTEAASVEPAPGSLEAIRRRAHAARRRRRAVATGAAAAVLAAVAVSVPALDRSGDGVRTGSGVPSTTAATDAPTSVPETLTADLDQALWPDPAGELTTDPVAAARSFVETFLGVSEPPLSDFLPGEPGAGEVEVHARGEDGRALDRVAATIALRQLDGEHWFVTSAGSDDVRIDEPEPLTAVAPPTVAVSGAGRGYEGTVVVALRPRSAPGALLAEHPFTAGGEAVLAPFAGDVWFETTAVPDVGVLVARTDVGAESEIPGFAAVAVRLPARGDGSPPGGEARPGDGDAAGTDDISFRLRGRPLWPFRSLAEADAWLATAGEGHSPWHADAAATALNFTNGFLGFTEIDGVTSTDVRADEAWIGVGHPTEGGRVATAAVIHLVRFGPSPDAPWEVVGTRDSTLTLDLPRYGSAAPSPLTVGGTISGVDESLRVEIRQASTPAPLGATCCLPAGGDAVPWETTVAFDGATDPAIVVVVSTGGHVQDVERFAITAVVP